MHRRMLAFVPVLLSLAGCASQVRTQVPPAPAASRTGGDFDRKWLMARLHHHTETRTLIQTCTQKSTRTELVDYCKELGAGADRAVEQLRTRAREWYGITQDERSDGEHDSELFREFAQRMKTSSGAEFDRATLQALRQQYRQGRAESEECAKSATHEELRTVCTSSAATQVNRLAEINRFICAWFRDCSEARQ